MAQESRKRTVALSNMTTVDLYRKWLLGQLTSDNRWVVVQLYTKRNSCVSNTIQPFGNSTRKDSSEEFRGFNMLVKRNHQNLQWSNSNSNSMDSSYFRRIAYRGLCSQTPCVKDTHSIIAMNRSGWIQESNSIVDSRTPRGDTKPGIPGSRPDFDRTHGRNTHLRSHKRRLQCVWLPHGSLKASLGHTELK